MCLCEHLAECHVVHVLVRGRDHEGEGNRRVVELAEGQDVGLITCEGCGDVVGVLTLLVGGVAQAFHDDRVVELRVQLGVEEVDGEGQEGTGRSRKGEASQRGAPMDMTVGDKVFAQDLSQMRCEMTSPGVKEFAIRARSTHGVHHAIVEVNIVIGVVLGEVHVVGRVHVSLVDVCDAVIDLTLGLIAHVVIMVFVVSISHRILLYWRYTVYTSWTLLSLVWQVSLLFSCRK